ncbi:MULTISPECIES: LolA family protein [Roseovarius]|jgi:outer membrane lipoprotein-sorting protein|uniref:Cell envelope biogenesis protein LolA n=1 Tax=Roseovarius nubinhibens TaxID=314263 RepID=A0A348WHL1_9RHOB|nr:outer membrane lipoprotein carrier protein LolA [Roseovarius nubinhibens]MBU2998505.1 outer membrane lipoprotein carrier protein LolA [Roseovarius nubinhibens]HAR54023.1 cell envelope biogenesis protein LolA [Roseovarius nubinhibens]|tara:strand:- start:60 stop:680 length:621 start_codon:yes stop_codon:yes gene_type:complete
MMNRRQILATGAACVALAAPIPATAAEKLSLGEISRYLNGITTASGDFTQINDDGTVSKGRVIIKRPGRVRFEYAPPDRTLVVSDGSTVGVIDGKSNEPPQGFPLNRTPLSIILARNVDLTRARMVTGHRVDGAKTIVQAQDPAHPEYGNIELVFTGSPVELRQWIINDGDGARTTVVLGGLRKGGNFSNDKFVIPGLKPGAAKDR